MAFNASRCIVSNTDVPSTSARCGDARRWLAPRPVHRTAGPAPPRAVLDVHAPLTVRFALCEPSRPPAGPSAILCSSLGKERKKLARVLKSHRKVLEKRLSALQRADVDAPVLSELLSELRLLTSRLESQRAASLLLQGMIDDSDSSSDSDDDECDARSAASLCSSRAAAVALQAAGTQPPPVTPPRTAPGVAVCEVAVGDSLASDTMLVSTLSGQIELPVPPPPEGWAWDEEEFRSSKFEGTGGRIMVCTGSKCQRKGATEVLRAVSALSEGNAHIEVVPCKCVGKCSAGAALRVRPQGQPCATYTQVRPAQLLDVFQEHFAAPAQPQPAPPQPTIAGTEAAACGLYLPNGASAHVACCAECQQD